MAVERKIMKLEIIWEEYRSIEDQVMENKLQIPDFDTDRVTLREFYENCIDELYNRINDIERGHRSTEEGPRVNKLKIKPMEIPQFNGEYHNWPNFQDLFTNAIIKNNDLNDAEKMQYLKSSVKQKASDAISHLKITEENFKIAWEILMQRFDNKRMQISAYVDTLLDLPQIGSDHAEGMIKFHDTVKDCMQALNSLKIDTNNWDALIIQILTRKMDNTLRKEYEMTINNPTEVQKLSELLSFLESKFRMLEILQRNEATKQKSENVNQKTMPMNKVSETTNKYKCNLCSESHYTGSCKKLTSLNEAEKRYELVKKSMLCFNCLSNTHKTVDCKSQMKCKKCGKRHHSLLHKEFNPANNNEATPKNTQPTKTLISKSDAQTEILLATAVVKIVNGNDSKLLRALIDQGSQSTFITTKAANILNLRKTAEKTKIAGIGNGESITSAHKTFFTMRPRYPSHSQWRLKP